MSYVLLSLGKGIFVLFCRQFGSHIRRAGKITVFTLKGDEGWRQKSIWISVIIYFRLIFGHWGKLCVLTMMQPIATPQVIIYTEKTPQYPTSRNPSQHLYRGTFKDIKNFLVCCFKFSLNSFDRPCNSQPGAETYWATRKMAPKNSQVKQRRNNKKTTCCNSCSHPQNQQSKLTGPLIMEDILSTTKRGPIISVQQ